MNSKRAAQAQNLTAKVASLVLAVIVWFLIKDLLDSQRRNGTSPDEPTILGPAINPDLQGFDSPAEPEKEVPTKH